MPVSKQFQCEDLSKTRTAGQAIAGLIDFPACVLLDGQMGAGKTTLCQAIIHALGYQGPVTSPTYNLIQEYPVAEGTIYHLDLYRLDDPAEIEFLGLADLQADNSMLLIEWPSRGRGYLPPETHRIIIATKGGDSQNKRTICLETL